MAAAPFSIGKIIGAVCLVAIILIAAYPMILQTFTPPGNTVTSQVYCQYSNNATQNANVSGIYYNATCLGQAEFGLNYSYNNNTQNNSLARVFSLVQSTSYNTKASANQTGFFVQSLQSSSVWFVFQGIGTIAQAVLNLGSIFSTVFGSIFGWLPYSAALGITSILKIISLYLAARLTMTFISAWSKYNIWDS